MKIKDLIKQLNELEDQCKDWEVVIAEASPSFGPSSSVEVNQLRVGFDWNSGKVFIIPKKPLFKKENL